MKPVIIKSLLYTSKDNTDYVFKSKSVESTSAKYEYLTSSSGYNYRKYLQRRPRSKHTQAIFEKLQYYNVINDQPNIKKYQRKLQQVLNADIPIYQSHPFDLSHEPALQSFIISTGFKSSNPKLELEMFFLNWCKAFRQKTYEWEYYGAYHEDTPNPHFHLVIFESKLKKEKLNKNNLFKTFTKNGLKRLKESMNAKTRATTEKPIFINKEFLQKLYEQIINIRTIKSARARNLLTLFLNLIGMMINKINLYDTKFRHLSYNHRDDLKLPRAIITGAYKVNQKTPVDYLDEYSKIKPDAINSSVGLIKKSYKQLKQTQLIRELQLYLDAIKTIPFSLDLEQYRHNLFLAMQKVNIQQQYIVDSNQINSFDISQSIQQQINPSNDINPNKVELDKLFKNNLIKPITDKQRHKVRIR